MITAEVLQRVFKLITASSQATGFTIDIGGEEFFVTARHNFIAHESMPWHAPDSITIAAADGAREIAVLDGRESRDATDVAVLRLGARLADPALILPATLEGMVLGQRAYMAGFPLDLPTGIVMQGGMPLPLIKQALIATFAVEGRFLTIDGLANKGLSGGPVVLYPQERRGKIQVVGVVSGYHPDKIEGLEGGAFNSGLLRAAQITYAVEAAEEML